MSYLDEYKRRMRASAGLSSENQGNNPVTLREAQINRAKDSQKRAFYDSPTLKSVTYNNDIVYAIQSDKYKDIELQTFLFEPNFDVKVGTLIFDGKYYYLAIMKNGDEIYPELLTKICNDTFEIPIGMEEKITKDRYGNPIYSTVPITETVYVSLSDKDYSISNNSIIPLPSGRINIEMQYKPEYLDFFHVNYEFKHSGASYKVTDIRVTNITPEENYLKVSATRVVNEEWHFKEE